MNRFVISSVAFSVALVMSAPAASQTPLQDDGYRLVASYPHDREAFTQGLEFRGRRLFESTGLEGHSTLRRVDLETGDVKRKAALSDEHFGEGMTIFDGRLVWLTWKSQKAFVYKPRTFERRGRFRYQGEGWGLTHNRRRLVMSNGSSELVFRSPRTFAVRKRIQITDGGSPIEDLNELEWFRGEILANVWQTDLIARIDPGTGKVVGWVDISALHEAEKAAGDPDVANGIAYMRTEDRLFVTGKFWRHIYEIELTDP